MSSAADDRWDELSAYLDGELDEAAEERVAARLASDPDYRAQFERLKQTWSALDQLPVTPPTERFSYSTLEMIAVATEEQTARDSRYKPWRRLTKIACGIGLAAACLGLGWGIGLRIWPDPDAELLRNLTVIEHLDTYRDIDSVEFLKLLEESNLFAEEPDHAD